MPLTVIAREALSDDERSAVQEYSASAASLHACAQGWERELEGYRDLQIFATGRARFLALNLDSAIQKHELAENATVYSGHGRRFSVVGSLVGDPNRLVGLNYNYPGYISTSSARRAAEDCLRARATHGTPVLLVLRLARGQPILPIPPTVRAGEAEYVLGRSVNFEIREAGFAQVDQVAEPVLQLVLVPPG